MTSKTHLAQGTVGLFIKELDLIGSRTGLFVREAPGNLNKKVKYSSFVFKSGLVQLPRKTTCLFVLIAYMCQWLSKCQSS